MMKRLRTCLIVASLLMSGIANCQAEEATDSTNRIGMHVDNFTLRDCYGAEHSLNDFKDKEVVVLAFLGTECPLVKLYARKLSAMAEEYKDNVAIVSLNSNSQDTITEMVAFANKYDVKFPMLKDLGNIVADQVKAVRTPEVFVLDKNRVVKYWGRIDDQYGITHKRDEPIRADLAEAINQLLAGKEVSEPVAESIGCHIGRSVKTQPKGDITYSNQIARLLNAKCVSCHREGQIAPFNLTKFEDTIGWGETIAEVIEQERMPPWNANPKHGVFKNDPRLTEEEKQMVYKWIDNGMPEGDAANLPEPPKFAEGWRIPQPDQIIYMNDQKAKIEIPAQGVVDYKYFVVDPGWEEDRYICAAEAKAGNTSVVHHIIAFIQPPGARGLGGAALDSMLVGYAPGTDPTNFDDGTAIYVPANSKLVFQMHYTPDGYKAEDLSYVGVKFIDEKDVKHLVQGRLAIDQRFRIPPNDDNFVVTATNKIARDSLLLNLTPHMHLRGKAFQYEAIYPDGKRETLLDVPRYDFNWQLSYDLKEPKLLPKGTKIKCTATFDNSENNLSNPDPSKVVKWGDQSWQEMMIGFFETIPAKKTDLKAPTVEASGKWSWGAAGKTSRLDFKMRDNGELNGTYARGGQTIEIRNGNVSENVVTFDFPMVFNGDAVVVVFEGRIEGDELSGSVVFDSGIGGREIPLLAKREVQ